MKWVNSTITKLRNASWANKYTLLVNKENQILSIQVIMQLNFPYMKRKYLTKFSRMCKFNVINSRTLPNLNNEHRSSHKFHWEHIFFADYQEHQAHSSKLVWSCHPLLHGQPRYPANAIYPAPPTPTPKLKPKSTQFIFSPIHQKKKKIQKKRSPFYRRLWGVEVVYR